MLIGLGGMIFMHFGMNCQTTTLTVSSHQIQDSSMLQMQLGFSCQGEDGDEDALADGGSPRWNSRIGSDEDVDLLFIQSFFLYIAMYG
jgi:hypothetical protein